MVAEAADSKRQDKREKRKSKVRFTEAQVVLGWVVVLTLIALLGAIYLFQTSHIASTGRMVQDLQLQLEDVKRINSELERDIAEAQSLNRLQREAKKYGFAKASPDEVEFLVVGEYPHENALSSTGADGETGAPFENFGAAIIDYVLSHLEKMVRGESP